MAEYCMLIVFFVFFSDRVMPKAIGWFYIFLFRYAFIA